VTHEGTTGISLQVRGLSKAFRGTWALRGVDLDLGPGETLVLFGPNGSGKTTLIKILATLLRPTRGTGTLGGADVVREREKVRRRVGLLSHGSYLYEELTPRENLVFAAALHGGGSPPTGRLQQRSSGWGWGRSRMSGCGPCRVGCSGG